MDLFLVRLENGDAVITDAKDEQDAIEHAGATGKGFKPSELASPEAMIEYARVGIGPQNCEVRKISELFIELTLSDEGEFELSPGDETRQEILQTYPFLDAAAGDQRWEDVVAEDWRRGDYNGPLRRELEARMREAVEKERTRLLVKTDPE